MNFTELEKKTMARREIYDELASRLYVECQNTKKDIESTGLEVRSGRVVGVHRLTPANRVVVDEAILLYSALSDFRMDLRKLLKR